MALVIHLLVTPLNAAASILTVLCRMVTSRLVPSEAPLSSLQRRQRQFLDQRLHHRLPQLHLQQQVSAAMVDAQAAAKADGVERVKPIAKETAMDNGALPRLRLWCELLCACCGLQWDSRSVSAF